MVLFDAGMVEISLPPPLKLLTLFPILADALGASCVKAGMIMAATGPPAPAPPPKVTELAGSRTPVAG